MTRQPALPALEPWPLAARLASAPASAPWTLVAVAPEQGEAVAEELKEQLASLLDAPVDLARVGSPQELFALVRREHARAVVIVGLDAFDAAAWSNIDVNRSRLSRDQPAILVLDERKLPLLVDHAPNLWSWLGSSTWRASLPGETGEA